MTKKNAKGGRGGPRPGAGRKAADGATDLVLTSVRLTKAQHRKFLQLGGSVWLRKKIDEAELVDDEHGNSKEV